MTSRGRQESKSYSTDTVLRLYVIFSPCPGATATPSPPTCAQLFFYVHVPLWGWRGSQKSPPLHRAPVCVCVHHSPRFLPREALRWRWGGWAQGILRVGRRWRGSSAAAQDLLFEFWTKVMELVPHHPGPSRSKWKSPAPVTDWYCEWLRGYLWRFFFKG